MVNCPCRGRSGQYSISCSRPPRCDSRSWPRSPAKTSSHCGYSARGYGSIQRDGFTSGTSAKSSEIAPYRPSSSCIVYATPISSCAWTCHCPSARGSTTTRRNRARSATSFFFTERPFCFCSRVPSCTLCGGGARPRIPSFHDSPFP